ncbi:MAG: twitch domain-containing radical SAM protein [Bacteriovoracaceae bacterium]
MFRLKILMSMLGKAFGRSRVQFIPKVPSELASMEHSLCLHQWDAPCVNLATGKIKACCRVSPREPSSIGVATLDENIFFNDQHNIDRRRDMLSGKKHPECNSCWNLEAKGAPSPRIGVPTFLYEMEKRLSLPRKKLIEMMLDPDKHPEILRSHNYFELEISLGNRCDLACVYCSYTYSSRIAQEEIEAGTLPRDKYEFELKRDNEKFQKTFWKWFENDCIQTLKVINFIGGEPLINDLLYENIEQVLKICERIPSRDRRKRTLQIITNLNAPPHYMKKFMNILPRLSKHFEVSILVSMESTGEKAEYIRYGVSWARFVSNFEELLNESRTYIFQLGFIPTISALSVTSTEEFLHFAITMTKKHSWPVFLGYNQVMDPQEISVLKLHKGFESYLTRAVNLLESERPHLPGHTQDFLQRLTQLRDTIKTLEVDPARNKEVRRWIEDNDRKRGTDFYRIFPEYNQLLS